MSAAYIVSTIKRNILLFAIVVAGVLLTPTSAVFAEELPVGVSERQTCGTYSVDIFGYGAGMMHTSEPITTVNRRVAFLHATEGCAVIEWDSSIPAASQVLVAKFDEEPVTIDTTMENFGYPIASTQNNAGLANHRAIVHGLEPNQAYSYRLVTRAHPSAIPTISDPHVLITGATAEFAPVNPAPLTPPQTTPITPTPPTPAFDFEKFPIVPSSDTTEPVSTPAEVQDEEAPASDDSAAGTTTVPSAITAADSALGNSQERAVWDSFVNFVKGLLPDEGRLSLSSNIGLFEEDKYIVPTLFFLVLIFLLQRLVLPAFGLTLENPLLYWLVGSVVLTVLSAVFMMYYVTLIGIALFLGLLAWYLLKSTPDDGAESSPQLKLLETKEAKKTEPQKKTQKSKK